MEGILGIIKTKMGDDVAFEAEFKTRQDEIKGIKEKIAPYDSDLKNS